MDSKEAEDLCNTTEQEEETIAIQRKQKRRVSFAAEITSVHVFDRDEDFETPPEWKPSSENAELGQASGDFGGDSDDSKEEFLNRKDFDVDEEEDEEHPVVFVRDMEYSSPGSAMGSLTSNEEDHFFGPVSTDFIRSRRLSDSGTSDDHNDITLDSTAFSLHFRSLMQSEERFGNSDSKTFVDMSMPTDAESSMKVDSKTPVDVSMTTDVESSMKLISTKKPISHLAVSYGSSGSGHDSNDMSLVLEKSRKYEYGKLSPALDALLFEGSKDVELFSNFDKSKVSNSLKSPNKSSQGIFSGIEMESSKDAIDGSQYKKKFDNASDNTLSPLNRKLQMVLIKRHDDEHLVHVRDQTVGKISALMPSNGPQILSDSPKGGRFTPSFGQNADQHCESPLPGSVSLLHAKRRHLFCDNAVSSATEWSSPLAREQPLSSIAKEDITLTESILSIKKSISKFKIFEAHKVGVDNSKLSLPGHLYETPLFDTVLDEKNENSTPKDVDVSACVIIDGDLRNIVQKNKENSSAIEMHSYGLETPKSFRLLKPNEDSGTIHNDVNSKLASKAISSSQLSGLQNNIERGIIDGDLQKNKENATIEMLSYGLETPKSFRVLEPNEDSRVIHNDVNSKLASKTISSSQLSGLQKNKEHGIIDGDLCNIIQKINENTSTIEMRYGLETPQCFRLSKPNADSGVIHSDVNSKLTSKAILSSQLFGSQKNVEQASLNIRSLIGGDRGDDHGDNGQSPLRPSFIKDVGSSRRKRKEISLMDNYHMNEIDRSLKSPKVAFEMETSFSRIPFEHNAVSNSEADKIGGEASPKHGTDVQSKTSGDKKELFIELTNKLNLQEIDILEDMLGQLQRAKKYEILRYEIQSQKVHDQLGRVQHQRVAEARWLQYRLVYEQAKLQLMRVKQDKFHRKVQATQCGIQECHKLKFNILQRRALPGTKDAQYNEENLPSLSVNLSIKNQDECNRVNTMRQEVGVLDQKVKNLIKSFHASCKIKGDLSADETIVLVEDYLKKKNFCRLICQELQLWELDDIESKKGHHNIVLNYGNLLFQRFVINAVPISSIVTSILLNDVNTRKNFPTINASTAFEFVFNVKGDRRLSSPKSFREETQVASFLLGNLLEVFEEIQEARIQIPNLIATNFHSGHVGQLELQLCFINFRTGWKVTLILDMTDLNCAIYPSEIIPSQLHFHPATQTTMPSLSAEITDAVRSLKAGYSRIIRLCHCVSQVVQASSR